MRRSGGSGGGDDCDPVAGVAVGLAAGCVGRTTVGGWDDTIGVDTLGSNLIEYWEDG